MSNPERICIFVHFGQAGEIAPAVLHYLQGLREICNEIVFVSNSRLTEAQQNKVSQLVSTVLERDNKGLDFGAWKHAIELVGWAHLQMFDELILANDSCYAPMFPFTEMFTSMSVDNVDFWGVTEHPAALTRAGNLEPHLQSYFLVFKRHVVASEVFQNFWHGVLEDSIDYNTVVGNYEATLTPALNSSGFSHRAYMEDPINIENVRSDWNNPLYVNRTIWNWRELLLKRSPFLKRKAFSFHFERVVRLIRSGYGRVVTKEAYVHTFFWRKCIENSGSDYPVDIICEEIRVRHGDVWVNSSHPGKRLMFYVSAPRRFFRSVKRRFTKS